ncbi:hypothetical protein GOODEAATRI_019100 [Goodea atripinnis]|uniref:Uncharacterized protein n=1 Tax=Goodea atripinnis TaxID=208336 RepID=A0ABV0MKZ2_9TELE
MGFAHWRHCAQIKQSPSSSMFVCSRCGPFSNLCVNHAMSRCLLNVGVNSQPPPSTATGGVTHNCTEQSNRLIDRCVAAVSNFIYNKQYELSVMQFRICHDTPRFLYLPKPAILCCDSGFPDTGYCNFAGILSRSEARIKNRLKSPPDTQLFTLDKAPSSAFIGTGINCYKTFPEDGIL